MPGRSVIFACLVLGMKYGYIPSYSGDASHELPLGTGLQFYWPTRLAKLQHSSSPQAMARPAFDVNVNTFFLPDIMRHAPLFSLPHAPC